MLGEGYGLLILMMINTKTSSLTNVMVTVFAKFTSCTHDLSTIRTGPGTATWTLLLSSIKGISARTASNISWLCEKPIHQENIPRAATLEIPR